MPATEAEAKIAFGAAADLGCPGPLIRSQKRFYDDLVRAFKYQDSVGP